MPAAELVRLAPRIAEIAAAPITPAVVQSLRRRDSVERAALILAIAAEQHRAAEKFGPGVWMVSAKAIRQATDAVVAAYKARLLGAHPVFDLCGGVGGDALALARRGLVVTIDREPQITAMAAANLKLAAARGAIAVCADVTRYRIAADAAVHIDPDRRPEQRRTVSPSNYLPSLDFVRELIDSRIAGIAKLAPAADLEAEPGGASLAQRHHRQWISLEGSVREQALLAGEAIAAAGVAPGGRSAVHLRRDGSAQRFAVAPCSDTDLRDWDERLPRTTGVAEVLIDIDPAIRAAGLSAAAAVQRGLAALGGPAGFFTAAEPPEDRSLLQCFETLWHGPADLRQIKRQLRRENWTLQSIKVRGTGHDPAELHKRLRPEPQRGKRAAAAPAAAAAGITLLIGRHRQGVYAAIGRALVAA